MIFVNVKKTTTLLLGTAFSFSLCAFDCENKGLIEVPVLIVKANTNTYKYLSSLMLLCLQQTIIVISRLILSQLYSASGGEIYLRVQ